jgi:amino acid transporter
LFDTVCLVVGIIVGAGIYETAPTVASSVATPTQIILLWLAGGVISLSGALCYTELAAAYPRDGGDVIYLSRAYGRWAGFLFGWIQLAIVRPGDIAAMSFVFAGYALRLLPAAWPLRVSPAHLASLAVIAFTLINLCGVQQARRTQNMMTILKVLGLAGLICVGLFAPRAAAPADASIQPAFPIGVAMVLVLFCYGGWNEVAYIAAEIESPQRNIFRAIVSGMGTVIGLYLLANLAFLNTLGHAAMASSSAVAVDVVAARLPQVATFAVAALISVSALGALNGQILTGARVSYSAGTEFHLLRRLGIWDDRRQTPRRSLLVQLAMSLTLILWLGSFDDTIIYTASTVYTFYLFSTLSVIVLRVRDPDTPRPYRVIGYPWTILLFAGACMFMMYSAITYRPQIAQKSLLILLCGLPLYGVSQRLGKRTVGRVA